ncbi:MAG: hypothetical protein ACYTGZ_17775 [Planctomycetota bacterium]|jgi:hypothetical protein
MRMVGGFLLVFVWAVPALAEEAKSPFRGELRKAMDSEGRISITVPKRWTDKELAEGQMLRVYALGSGGHDITLHREKSQADVDTLRDRYLQHDSGKFPGCTIKKIGEPYFGYRLDSTTAKRVVVRAFAVDGPDGLVLTITSRIAVYDQYYASKLAWVASTLNVGGVRTGTESGGEVRVEAAARAYDKAGSLSVHVPAGWRAVEPEDEEILFVAPGGRKAGTRVLVKHWGGSSSASLVLAKVAAEWKRSYGGAVLKRLQGSPPRLLVKGRAGDSVDYFIGVANGDEGYTVRLIVREGSYERTRNIADEIAASLVFTTAPWKAPTPPDRDLKRDHKKMLVLHAAAEISGGLDKVAAEFDRFLKHWMRLGLGFDRKAPPIHALICANDEFAGFSNLFGEPPAVYDRLTRTVVAVTPPKEEKALAEWKGALDSAFAEALLHRDVNRRLPAWMRRGLASCMFASGRTGGKPNGEVPALAGILLQRTEAKLPDNLGVVFGWPEGDYLRDDSRVKQAHAWGYVHLMLFGKGGVPNAYKKWKKALLKSKNRVPKFDLKKYKNAREDLLAHVAKNWGEAKK